MRTQKYEDTVVERRGGARHEDIEASRDIEASNTTKI
jgi:hypothetical protein